MIERRVRQAIPDDITVVYDLQNKLHDSVGYTPRGGLVERIEHRRILIAEENDEPAGYVSFTHRIDGATHLPQIAVHPDLWRTALGKMLWDTLVRSARIHASTCITIKCAGDLPSNRFWKAIGCLHVGTLDGPRRLLNLYNYPLHPGRAGLQPAPRSPRTRPIIPGKLLLTP